MKKIPVVLSLATLILVFAKVFAQNKEVRSTGDFNGHWVFTTESSVFDLLLTQKGSILTGSHCSTMLKGNKIDCFMNSSDVSINGTVKDSNMVTIDFKSYFSGSSGKAALRKISTTKMEWKIIEEPKGEFYLPDSAILTKI